MANPPLSIAVVDDDLEVRAALVRLAASAGFEVSDYGRGDDFLQAAARCRPDCVVLDLHMPGMSGFDVLQALTQQRIDVPVVAITGYDSPAARASALDLGARAYLCKPVDDKTLLDAITTAGRAQKRE